MAGPDSVRKEPIKLEKTEPDVDRDLIRVPVDSDGNGTPDAVDANGDQKPDILTWRGRMMEIDPRNVALFKQMGCLHNEQGLDARFFSEGSVFCDTGDSPFVEFGIGRGQYDYADPTIDGKRIKFRSEEEATTHWWARQFASDTWNTETNTNNGDGHVLLYRTRAALEAMEAPALVTTTGEIREQQKKAK